MKRILLPVFLLFALSALSAVFAEDTPLDKGNSRVTYRRLTWDDFRVDDKTPGMSAQTHTFITFAFKARVTGRDGSYSAVATEMTFDGGFDRERSWRRSYIPLKNELLLTHEQGHFDISELKLRQLRRRKTEEMPFGYGKTPDLAYNDLKKQLDTLYHAEVADLEKIQHRYDEETDHGTRREIQAQWTQRLSRALLLLPPVTVAKAG